MNVTFSIPPPTVAELLCFNQFFTPQNTRDADHAWVSPDGLVGDNGLLEAKCPFKERNLTIEEASQSASLTVWKKMLGVSTDSKRITSTGTKRKGNYI